MTMTEKKEITFEDMGIVIGGVHRPHIKLTHITKKHATNRIGMLGKTVSLEDNTPHSKTSTLF